MEKLQKDTEHICKWFLNKRLKSSSKKRHFIASSKAEIEIAISNCLIKNKQRVTLLGIDIYVNLNFDKHNNHLFKKTNQKLHALTRKLHALTNTWTLGNGEPS